MSCRISTSFLALLNHLLVILSHTHTSRIKFTTFPKSDGSHDFLSLNGTIILLGFQAQISLQLSVLAALKLFRATCFSHVPQNHTPVSITWPLCGAPLLRLRPPLRRPRCSLAHPSGCHGHLGHSPNAASTKQPSWQSSPSSSPET